MLMKRLIALFSILMLVILNIEAQTTFTLTGSSWSVPCGVTTVTVKVWGGGGAGGTGNNIGTGGGGGGSGAYASFTMTVPGGSSIGYTIGASSTGNGNPSIINGVTAGGGFMGASPGTGGIGGTVSGTLPAGGTFAVGIAGVAQSVGTGGTGSGSPNGGANSAGGANGGGGAIGTAGSAPGGGGGGGSDKNSKTGGAGAAGRITVTYNISGPPTVNAGANQSLGACTTTVATLAANTISSAGWTGSWQCIGCTGITITNTISPTSSITGLTAGTSYYLQWVATFSTGCSVNDDVLITVPSCAQTNGNCSGATSLTVGGALTCGQVTSISTVEVGECYLNGAGGTEQTVWYRLTATNDSLVLNFVETTAGTAVVQVFGPFSSGGGCIPACTNTVYSAQQTGDPGHHILLKNLTIGSSYLIQIEGISGGGFSPPTFCINVVNPANNFQPTVPVVVNNCGITYNGTTNGGYFQTALGAGFNNLDNNATTTCSVGCAAGEDVSFVINNPSWFSFCTVNAGTYNVAFDVTNCVFAAPNGAQMAILKGSPTSFTNIGEATNPMTPSSAIWTSSNFNVVAGGCVYMVVDGFGGDACNYSYVLSNISGGCVLLAVDLLSFNALQNNDLVDLTWATATEINNDYFTVERSDDGINFKEIEKIDGTGISSNVLFYSTIDKHPLNGISYYRLKQTDFNQKETYSKIVSVDFENMNDLKFNIVPNPNIENTISNIVLSNIPNKEITLIIADPRGVNLFEVTKKIDSNKIEIPNNFAKGIYFVKVISSDFAQTKRMIIK